MKSILNFFDSVYSIFKSNLIFFILYLVSFVAGGIYLLKFSKGSLSIWINGYHNTFLDQYFRYATWIGDGLFVVGLSVVLILFRPRLAIVLGFAYTSTGILAQILKRIFDTPRPKLYFGTLKTLYFVPGIEILSYHSFPSGHSATAFSAFLIISYFVKNKALKAIFFVIALSVALSRVYLLQHFLVDIYFGSLIGVLGGIICIIAVDNWRALNTKWWLDYSFYQNFIFKLKNR